jgi:hypothetical protein
MKEIKAAARADRSNRGRTLHFMGIFDFGLAFALKFTAIGQ